MTFGVLGTPVTIDGLVELDVFVAAGTPDGAISARWGDGVTPTDFPVSNRVSAGGVGSTVVDPEPSDTTNEEEPASIDNEPIQVDLGDLETDAVLVGTFPPDGGNIIVTSTQGPIQAGGLEFIAEPGTLTQGSSPSPFAFFIPNGAAPGNVTFGVLGTPVTIDGSVELDVAVSPSTVTGDITARWGMGVTPIAFPVVSQATDA